MKDDYCINSYIKDEIVYNYYRYVNTDFINNKFAIGVPYIQILSFYRNPILQSCSQLQIYLSFIENKTNEEVLNYLLELYVQSLIKLKCIEMNLIDILNPTIKRLIEIFIFSKDFIDPKDCMFNSKSFLSHKQDFLRLIKMYGNMEHNTITADMTDLIYKILTTNITVNLYYKLEDTIKFENDLFTYFEYKQEFVKQQKNLRVSIENYNYFNDNSIDIPPIDKTFNFNNLLLYNDEIIEDKLIIYTLFKIDIINVFDVKKKSKRSKKYKKFIAMTGLIKENDSSLTSIEPFLKKYNKQFESLIEYINSIYKSHSINHVNINKLFFIPYCIIHIIPKYELYKFINTKNPLLKIKKTETIFITDDNVIIDLFTENKINIITKKKVKKSKNKNHVITDISNSSNNSIIELNQQIENTENNENGNNENGNNENGNIELKTDTDTDTDTDDEGFELVTYKNTNIEFDYYDIVFNNINFKNKNIIEILIYQLYENNNNFVKLMKKYNIIRIIKDIHKDKFYLNEILHFNTILINNKNGETTTPLHFYIKNNRIYNITQVIHLI